MNSLMHSQRNAAALRWNTPAQPSKRTSACLGYRSEGTIDFVSLEGAT